MTSTTTTATPGRQRSPQPARLALAAVLSIVVASLLDTLLAVIGRSVFSVPSDFPAYQPVAYIMLTVVGIVGASIAWNLIASKAQNPTALLHRLAVIIVPVSMLADLALLFGGSSVLGVFTLMVMHVAVGVPAYYALTRLAPPRPAV